jgi:integrase
MTKDLRQDAVTGHIYLREGKRGSVWYAKYRIGEQQTKKKLGPAWGERGRPPEGYLTEKTADAALQAILTDARRGTIAPRSVGVTFADASAEWLRYCEHERAVKRSTLIDYRSIAHVLDADLGKACLDDIDTELLERWLAGRDVSNRTRQKYVNALNMIFRRAKRVWKLATNPAVDLERPRVRNTKDIETYTPEEVWALVRQADEQDGASFLVAAFCGLRIGEVLALRVREVDFARRVIRVVRNYVNYHEETPKSHKMRAVPMAEPVARALAQLLQREHFTDDGDLVFPNEAGDHQDPKCLRERYREAQDAAGLRPLDFHDLRHCFGTLAIDRASALQVKTWMGHADLATTERYLHYRDHGNEAELLTGAFESELGPELGPELSISQTTESN